MPQAPTPRRRRGVWFATLKLFCQGFSAAFLAAEKRSKKAHPSHPLKASFNVCYGIALFFRFHGNRSSDAPFSALARLVGASPRFTGGGTHFARHHRKSMLSSQRLSFDKII
jgi:hypothetical protein